MVKRTGMIILALLLSLFFTSTISAESNNVKEDSITITPVNLDDQEVERLMNLGFAKDEIERLSQEEYEKTIGLEGELDSVKEVYYEIKSDVEGNVTSVSEVSKTKAYEGSALAKKAEEAGFISPMSCCEETSWMKMTTTSSKLTNGNVFLRNAFEWLTRPGVGLTDVVGLSHSASAIKHENTVAFYHTYRDGTGVKSVPAKRIEKQASGVAAVFDLKVVGTNEGAHSHKGHISVQVSKGNTGDIQANAYGHYIHTTFGITGTVTIRTGAITIGGTRTQSKMPDTLIRFNY